MKKKRRVLNEEIKMLRRAMKRILKDDKRRPDNEEDQRNEVDDDDGDGDGDGDGMEQQQDGVVHENENGDMEMATFKGKGEGEHGRSRDDENDSELAEGRISSPPDDQEKEVEGTASVMGSVANLMNTIIGGGVLALPYAIKTAGAVLGPLFLIMVYLLTNLSLYFLLKAAESVSKERLFSGKRLPPHRFTYRDVTHAAFGKSGGFVSDASIILTCFGTMCSYLVIIADMIIPIINYFASKANEHDLYVYRQIVVTGTLFLVIPLACLRKLDSLKFTSVLAIISIFYVTVMVLVRFAQSTMSGRLDICVQEPGCFNLWILEKETTSAVPIITLAFTCHMNFFTIYNELRQPSMGKMGRVGVAGTTLSCFCYLLASMSGYLTFFNQTKGNILLNYPTNDILIIIARVAVAITISLSFPMMSHPCVKTLDNLLSFISYKVGRHSQLLSRWHSVSANRRWITLAIFLSLLAWMVAILVMDVTDIFSFVGATGSATLAYILPSACFLALCPIGNSLNLQHSSFFRRQLSLNRLAAWGLLLFGFGFMILRICMLFIS